MQSCAIDSQQRYFGRSHPEKELSVKLAQNGRKNIWSVKVGVHLSVNCTKAEIKHLLINQNVLFQHSLVTQGTLKFVYNQESRSYLGTSFNRQM